MVGALCAAAGVLVLTQGRAAQPAAPAPAAGQGAAPAGGRGRADQPGADFLPRPPIVRQSPDQEQKLFLLPDGFHIENVLADPAIEDPAGVTFDANGRMYVLEMRSYMQDVAGTGELAPVSQISRWEDTNGDGHYDHHTIFLDHLVLPRIAFPLQDGVLLVLETNNRDLYKYTDTNGDGVADKKELFYPGFGRVQSMEWQPGGLTWALDNWLYSTYNPFRLRIGPDGKVQREETAQNGGQWWSTQDNYGKTWWVDGGGEIGPVNFQEPVQYGAFNVPDNFEPGFQVPWSAPGGLSDMQGGMNRVKVPEGTLNHFTAAAGPAIYRGDRLPKDLVGDLFFEEPVGRIVRRAKVVVTDGLTQLRNAYPNSEFVRSTDPLFRPVTITNAPDGTLYLMDMYTGIIQDAQFVGPGSYLARKVEQYQLDKQHNWGRIWRITYEGMEPNRTRPRMYQETAAQLVGHLTDPNGWWRDTAQEQLVLRQDKSVVPALQTMARTSTDELARIHAMWTLEGLNALDASLVRTMAKDPDAQIRIQAIRASESLYKGTPGDKSFANDYRAMLKDPDPNVVIQAMLTMNLLQVPQATQLIRQMADTSTVRGIKEIGHQLLEPGNAQGQRPSLADAGTTNLNLSIADRRAMNQGDQTFHELCYSCHGTDGKGAPLQGGPAGTTMAPPLAGSPRVTGHRNYVISVLLNGLTGPVDGKDYNGGQVMVPMGQNTDEWIADVANYVRNSFGNSGMFITPDDVAAVRAATTRKTPWTEADLAAVVPTELENSDAWTLTASDNADAAPTALGGGFLERWDTGAPQKAGMWFQIELPEATQVAEVQIDSAASTMSFNAGGRGRGGRAGGGAGRGAAAGRGGARGAAAGRGAGRGFARPAPATGPIAYKVQTSTDGTTWSAPVAQGDGGTPTTIISFKPATAKYIRITQTGSSSDAQYWAIQGLRVYKVGK